MPRQEIILGTPPTGLGGDPPRVASMKINAMTLELYEKSSKLGTAALADVLGTMTSGAIIERGSNANGEFTRWADGTQICWLRFSGYIAHQQPEGLWPISFSAFPAVSCSVQPAAAYDYQWMAWANGFGGWGFRSTSTAQNIVTIMGAGRWK